ncbi:hypothetical protein CDD83_2183 [Cordyceps sp. RAO-2017]|nr:hypothetical protein CDD83_2183 [Cordyceps sp. RAO-2017]
MAATIKPLDGRSVHQIQSGQVIVDLCSVVKELLENSIDAGATKIDVRFKNQGLDLIEVQDNGTGIDPANYEYVALKHYTSKISCFSDIASLESFGFRGEALASLCALANLSVTTCLQRDVPKGSKLSFETSGRLRNVDVIAAERGTTVSVDGLFHNLPVRRRELNRHIKREWQKALTLLHQYASIQTNVKFSVTQQPTKGTRIVLFSTRGNLTTRENLINIFGVRTVSPLISLDLDLHLQPSTSKQLIPHSDNSSNRICVSGHVSRPSPGDGRQMPDRQMFFVNGRPCALPQLAKLFNDVYKSYNCSQSPFIFADLQLNTDRYDVNVSPDKRCLLLHDQSRLLDSLRSALKAVFDAHEYELPIAVSLGDDADSRRNKLTGLPIIRPAFDSHLTARTAHDLPSGDGETSLPDPDQNPAGEAQRQGNGVSDNPSWKSGCGPSVIRHGADRASEIASQFVSLAANNLDHHPRPQLSINLNTAWRHDSNQPLAPSAPARAQGQQIDRMRRAENLHEWLARNGTSPASAVGCAHGAATSDTGDNSGTHTSRQVSNADAVYQPHTLSIRDVSYVPLHSSSTSKLQDTGAAATPFDTEVIRNPNCSRRRKGGEFDESTGSVSDTGHTSGGSFKSSLGQDVDEIKLTDDDFEELVLKRTSPLTLSLDENRELGAENNEISMPSDEANQRTALGTPQPAGSAGTTSKRHANPVNTEIVSGNAMISRLKPLLKQSKPFYQHMQHHCTSERAIQSLMDYLASNRRVRDLSIPVSDQLNTNSLEATDAESKLTLIVSRGDFLMMRVVGQFNVGFILAVRPATADFAGSGKTSYDELFIIDQHASDEKYNFERLQSNMVLQSQQLVHPKRLHLTASEEEIVTGNLAAIEANGFKVSIDATGNWPVGMRCEILALPHSQQTTFTQDDLEELISLLGDEPIESNFIPRPSKIRTMLAMRACRSSIMIGKALNSGQMQMVVRQMAELDKPWNCPHGRPTMRHLFPLRHWDVRFWDRDATGTSLSTWKLYV